MKGQGLDETWNVECEIQAQALTYEICSSKRFDLPLGCVNSGFERWGVFIAEWTARKEIVEKMDLMMENTIEIEEDMCATVVVR